MQIRHDLLDQCRLRSGEDEQIFGTLSSHRKNNKVLAKEFWLASDVSPLQIDRARECTCTFSCDKNEPARLFIRGDKRAEQIYRNPASASANAWHSPGNRFAQNIFPAKNRSETRWQTRAE